MPSTLYGPPAVEQQDDRDFEPIQGSTRRRIVRGRRAEVESYLVAQGLHNFPHTINSEEGGLCTATVTLGTGDTQDPTDPDYNPNAPISIEWNFSSNTLEKALWEHPKVVAPIAALSQQDLANLRKWIADMQDGKVPTVSLPSNVEIQTMANLIARGIETFYVPQATLVQNMRFTPATTYWPVLASIATVYTNADLVDVFHVPADVQAVLPQGEWISMRVDYQRDSSGYRNTTQEWAYAKKWHDWIYVHFPNPPGLEMQTQMNGILLAFEDWLKIRFPGLVLPAPATR